MKKNPYYVFLDIDGTLWDYDFRIRNKELTLNPQSLMALNYLLDNISQKYEVRIVMTSKRRQFFEKHVIYCMNMD